ncbi:MAG: bifunctional 5,10-methylene-tetrahydrofolate dehydrogenase/ 5,10-methylene-tetrahydrofolate cyclohydrolase, partial [Lactobacillus sp.]|nr:bifunctional 5,10-methylene-tetrahydrofolate dehydrogenase/ 5,10-methylene-tetrahydrofolate cyclohydrolase [Lactobacillus sp.]
KIVGDVDYAHVTNVASYITPVPGGVGPLTVESLMEQVVQLTRRKHGK